MICRGKLAFRFREGASIRQIYIYIYLRVCKNAFLLCAFAFIFPLQAPSLLYPLSLRSTAVCRLQEISEEPKIWVPFKIKQSIYTLLLLRIMKYTYSKDCITLINTYDINWYKYKMISKEQTVDKSPQPSTAQQPPCFSKVIPTNKHSKTHTHRKPQKKTKKLNTCQGGPLPAYPFIFGHV